MRRARRDVHWVRPKVRIARRTGASKDFPSVGTRLPGDCTLGFTGYCFGQTLTDAWLELPDERWFRLADGNWVASSVILGNPAPDTDPQPCPGQQPAPTLTGANLDSVSSVENTGRTVHVHADPAEVTLAVAVPPRTTALAVVVCAAAASPTHATTTLPPGAPTPDRAGPGNDPQARHAACRAPDPVAPHQ